ncbi:hypothetical protein KA005_76950 [bacterium]|nr:hypothetical protein [bacterium]
MKLRNHVFLFVFVLFFTFLLFRPSATGQTECQSRQTVEEIMELIKMGSTVVPQDPRDKKEDVAQKIFDDYLKICQRFEEGDFKGMEDLLGKKASLKVDGRYIRGMGKIRDYFEEQRGTYQRVEFVLLWAVIVHEDKKPIFARNSDNMVYENFEFHLINQRGGEIIKNQDGGGERSGRHIHGCEWIGN